MLNLFQHLLLQDDTLPDYKILGLNRNTYRL